MEKEYRCACAVNKIVDWNENKNNEKYILELKRVLYELHEEDKKVYLSICIRSKESNKEVVYFAVKRTGSLIMDIRVLNNVQKIIGLSYKQRILKTNGWLRIECGYDEIENLLTELDKLRASITPVINIW